MPNVKLPTRVDVSHETHGQGEPLIFVPSTAYSGEVWKPSQMALAQSLNITFHDPREDAAVPLPIKTSTPSNRWPPTSWH